MNEEKFSGKGALYKKYRPSYPKEAIEKAASLSDCEVLSDIGSGTGIFTRLLAPYFKKAFAVEPNSDMRTEAEESFSGTNIISLSGTAERTGIEGKTVSLVTAAQAFHWFDKKAFKKECERILKPGGKVLLIWNEKDQKDAMIKELFDLNKKISPSFYGFSGGEDQAKTVSEFFSGRFEECSYRNGVFYDEESFIGRNLSSSYAPGEDNENYGDYVSALKSLFSEYEKGGLAEFPYKTHLYFGGLE